MKLYRAIEFGKLVFMLDSPGQHYWNEIHAKRGHHWWLSNGSAENKKTICSYVASKCSDGFFSRSLEYNAMVGGRFNPARSFGMLYSSTHPILAALEVLFHQFSSLEKIHNGMVRNKEKIAPAFDLKLSNKLESIIVAFEIDFRRKDSLIELGEDSESLQKWAKKVGFSRYVSGRDFSRDFIFGNDYTIANILGCHVHASKTPSIKVPSARLDFITQDEMELRNVVIPEKDIRKGDPKLTGRFIEFRCEIEMQQNKKGLHPVKITCPLLNSKVELQLNLQPTPIHKRIHSVQIVSFAPDIKDLGEKRKYSREVRTQKFVA